MTGSSDGLSGPESTWDDWSALGCPNGYDDASAADRRAVRALRRFARDIDRSTTASQAGAATDRLLARLRATRAESDDD